MKKRISVLAALCTAAVWCVPVSADDTTVSPGSDQKIGSTTVTTSIDEQYVVVIPEKVSLGSELKITSSEMNTEPGMQVRVRISEGLSDGMASLVRQKDASGYTIRASVWLGESAVTPETIVAAFADQSTDGLESANGVLHFGEAEAPDTNPIKAGAYEGSLTFSISYESE